MREKISMTLNIIQTLVLILILVVLLTGRKEPEAHPMQGSVAAQKKEYKPIELTGNENFWGKKDAPVTMVAFIDYECPYCKDLYKNIKETEEEYITTGKVRVLFKHLPLKIHKNAMELAVIAECAGNQGKFWEMTDLILGSNEKYDSTKLEVWTKQLGLDTEKLLSCKTENSTKDIVQKDMNDAKERQITGTPGFWVNKEFHRGTMQASDLKALFEGRKVEKKQKAGACGQK